MLLAGSSDTILALYPLPYSDSFSEFFEKQDKEEMGTFSVRKLQNKMYRSLLRQWQKPLEKKRLRRERIAIIKANEKVPQPEPDKMVVHNAAVGVQFPALPTEEFCIILVDNFQYKVMKDSVLVLDRKPEHDLNLIVPIRRCRLTSLYSCTGARPTPCWVDPFSRTRTWRPSCSR